MKQKLKLIGAVLCGAFAVTSAFGQSTEIWTNGVGSLIIDQGTNWNPSLPATGTSDEAQFNGVTTGPLNLINVGAGLASGPGGSGINLHLTGSQTSPVSINSPTLATGPGLAVWNYTIDSGAGGLTLGSSSSAHVFYLPQRPSGAIHTWQNNSANPCVVLPWILFKAGGGAAYTIDFSGTGVWNVTNNMEPDNSSSVTIALDGGVTVNWNPPGTSGYNGGDPITAININAGTLNLANAHAKLASRSVPMLDNGAFLYAAPSGLQSYSGVISGSGTVTVGGAGTLDLKGANTYTGNTILNGGEILADRAENPGTSGPLGNAGLIAFNGGTLGYSANNQYDYSPRFSNAVNQAYSIDTAGQTVTLTNNLTSSGGTFTKLGAGTLTLSGANTYSGATTINQGKLVLQGSQGSGSIGLGNSAALGVYEGGAQITPSSISIGAGGSTLEFNNVTSTTTAPLATSGAITGGLITINVNSGVFNTVGQVFPLFSWTSGNPPPTVLGTLTGAGGTISTNLGTQTIQLTITSLAFIWTGNNNDNWDTTTANNWKLNGAAATFQNGSTALFDDTVTTANTNITLNADISTASVTVNNSAKPYSITSTPGNIIDGSGSLTKSGNGSLTIAGGLNNYSGATIINGGLVSVGALANGLAVSDIGSSANSAGNLVLNGGTLQYNNVSSTATSDRLLTVTTTGGTIDNEGTTLTFNNTGNVALSGSGARTFTLTGNDASGDTFSPVLADNGGATAFVKAGTGTWILTGLNTHSGVNNILGGTLQVGTGGASALGTGSVTVNGTLIYNTSATITNGAMSGTGSVTLNGTGTVVFSGNVSYAGNTTINSGTLQYGIGGATGTPDGQSTFIDNGTLIFDTTTPAVIQGFQNTITGTGNVIVRAGAITSATGNGYTGWTEIDPGATFQPCLGQTSGLFSSVVTNNGTFKISSQNQGLTGFTFGYSNNIVGSGRLTQDIVNQNAGWAMIAGTNSYTGGTFIGGGGLILGDNVNPGAGTIVGPVIFTNTTGPSINAAFSTYRVLDLYYAVNTLFTNPIISNVTDGSTAGNSGQLEQSGVGIVTLTANNTYPGGTVIDVGTTLQVGNGGTTGAIGNGGVTDNGTLVVDRSNAINLGQGMTGTGSLIQFGTGTLTLGASNTYTGATSVSNGTLVAVSLAGDVDMNSGTTLVPGSATAAGTLAVGGALNLANAAITVTCNKSMVLSNSTISAVGGVTASGATLNVQNVGPSLQVGDQFYIFSGGPVTGITTVNGPGSVTFSNGLAVDGSITVLTATATNPTNITAVVSGGNLNLSWPADHTGWRLQVQTNAVSVGLSNSASAWYSVPGSSSVNTESIPMAHTGAVFYRLVYP